MKTILIFMLLCTGFMRAQYLLEDMNDNKETTENSNTTFSVNVYSPEFYKITTCDASKVTYPKYSNGYEAFRKEFFKNIIAYSDSNSYLLNGPFYIIATITKEGKISNVTVKPNVPHIELLQDDMKYILKKMNGTWTPATCNGTATDAKARFRVNFKTESSDL